MALGLVFQLVGVSTLLVVAILREYRLQHRPGLTDNVIMMHAFRMLGLMLAGLGALGLLLNRQGYGGPGPTIEGTRVGVVLGVPVGGPTFGEGSSKLAAWSWSGVALGLEPFAVCTLVLWWSRRTPPPSPKAGA